MSEQLPLTPRDEADLAAMNAPEGVEAVVQLEGPVFYWAPDDAEAGKAHLLLALEQAVDALLEAGGDLATFSARFVPVEDAAMEIDSGAIITAPGLALRVAMDVPAGTVPEVKL